MSHPPTRRLSDSTQGEMARRLREHDWAATSLGPIDSWPSSLRTATAMLLASPAPMVMAWGSEARLIYNDGYALFAGERHPGLFGMNVLEGWPEVAAFNAEILRITRGGESISYRDFTLLLYRHGRQEPETVYLDLDYSPLYDDEGTPAGFFAIVVETTARIAAERAREMAEQQQQVLINELNHRVKNTMAVVQAMAAQTFRRPGADQEAAEVFTARLIALSRAHDALTRASWESAGVAEIVAEMAWPVDMSGRIHCHGPDIRLAPHQAVTLGMALHELATNALKYGALSNDGGNVHIQWHVDGQHCEITWREAGGPAVQLPGHRGFGTRLIERTLGDQLGGQTNLAFAPGGVICRISLPIT
ncbi:MAG TPA: HWE histidine kinase domain-containing protein [Pinirhizobacter sp.]|uniref:sensor histidine kinase n=1 Tax=Pinirhizobacter sp. TaxID=2950432 RepID=UPI002C03E61F|nr:HWE histidine kinase domain-containing protein [Pinirhizobacter sp.]HMH68613.1 HWE histidine kinase domain-containing protein [Pinirhizobacter sp.]